MSAHTPGPWTADLSHFPVLIKSTDRIVAEVHTDEDADGEARILADTTTIADAKVMAAAPNLALALHGLLERYTGIVNSGDCGNWDPEEEQAVIAARAALSLAGVP